MKVLLDTHFVIWLISDVAELTRTEHELLIGSGHELIVSTLSIFELRLKIRANERRGAEQFAFTIADVIDFCRDNGLPIVAPADMDYAVPLVPPLSHTDPFDEMLLVHAQQLGARLLTRDGRLRGHPVALSA